MFIKPRNSAWIFFIFGLLITSSSSADSDRLESLLKMDISELMEIPVLMPSRTMERQFDATSAIYVITQEDIRRSGLNRIPELLRMVPGVSVNRLDNNTWAVGTRSAVSRLNNSMLVLLDGRTLYNPLFGGVYWDVQDLFLEDVDRIEVIRGPGGSLWGSNAVNGIINIITKSAKKTNYTTLNAGVGQGDKKYDAGVRLGGEISPGLSARLYAKSFETDQGEYLDSVESTNTGIFAVGDDAYDNGRNKQAGFRLDWDATPGSLLSVTGDSYDGIYHNIRTATPNKNTVKAKGNNLVLKWDKNLNEKSATSLQFYIDHTKRQDIIFKEERKIYDLDFQHSLTLSSSQLTWGIGVRYTEDKTQRDPVYGIFELDPTDYNDTLLSAFIQDRISIVENKVVLTFGSKFEENEFTSGEIQPSVKLLWKIDDSQTFWSSLTRAIRTPTRSDLHAQLNFGGPPVSISDPNAQAESVLATEVGYRSQTNATTLLDLTVFNHNYSDPNSGTLKLGRTYGLEFNLNHKILNNWRTETSYTWHNGYRINSEMKENNSGLTNTILNFRSLYDINSNWEFDTFITYKEAHESPNVFLEDHIRVDIRLGWNPYSHSRTSLTVTNLFDQKHAEVSDSTRVNTTIGRAIFLSTSYDLN